MIKTQAATRLKTVGLDTRCMLVRASTEKIGDVQYTCNELVPPELVQSLAKKVNSVSGSALGIVNVYDASADTINIEWPLGTVRDGSVDAPSFGDVVVKLLKFNAYVVSFKNMGRQMLAVFSVTV